MSSPGVNGPGVNSPEKDAPEVVVGADEAVVQDGVGVPDELERLWTPYRMAYIRGRTSRRRRGGGGLPVLPDTLPRRRGGAGGAPRRDVLRTVLNLYPYSPGHLLVCPFRHIADYTVTTEHEAVEMADLTKTAMAVVRSVSGPHGFNIGMNQGAVAGAGIAAHLHQHVVPRWAGDQNFMPIIGRTRTLPQLMAETRDLLAEAWPG